MLTTEISATTPNQNKPGVCRTAISATSYLFLSYFSLGLLAPQLTAFFVEKMCARVGLDAAHCHPEVNGEKNPRYDDAQAEAAAFSATFYLILGVPQIAVCALWGCVGDAYGRRLVLIPPVVAGMFQGLVPVVSSSLNLMLASATLGGFFGGNFVLNLAAFSSLADVTQHASARQRSLVFGIVEGTIFIALLTGPIVGGVIAENFGMQVAFGTSLALGFLNVIITLCTYCETLELERRRPLSWKRVNPFTCLIMFAQSRSTLLFAVILACGLTAQAGAVDFISFYSLKVANLSPTALGLLQSIVLGNSSIGLMLLMPILVRCMPLTKIMVISCLNGVICWMLMSFVSTEWGLYTVSMGLLLPACFFPVVRCGMTNTFGPERYGESLAAVGVLEQVSAMMGPPILDGIYHLTEATEVTLAGVTVHSIASISAAVLYLLAAVAGMFIKHVPQDIHSCPTTDQA